MTSTLNNIFLGQPVIEILYKTSRELLLLHELSAGDWLLLVFRSLLLGNIIIHREKYIYHICNYTISLGAFLLKFCFKLLEYCFLTVKYQKISCIFYIIWKEKEFTIN